MSGFGRRVVFGEALLRAMKLGAPLGALPVRADAAPTHDPPVDSTTDIRKLGAIGDGVADDTEAFRSALSARAAVFVPPGVYRVTGTLKLDSSTLYGAGPHSVLKCGNADFHLLEVGGTGSRLRSLSIVGAATDEASSQFGVMTSTTSPPDDFSVFDVRFSDLNSGVKFEDQARNCRIENNHFERLVGKSSGHGYGILTGQVDGLIVVGNTFVGSRAEGHGRHAVYVSAGGRRVTASHNIIREFNCEALTTAARQHQPPVDEVIFADNIIDRCGGEGVTQSSISVFGRAGTVAILNNIIHESFGCGVLTESGPMVQENVVIDGNVVVDSANIGIRQFGALRQVVRNNYVRGSSRMKAAAWADIFVGSGGTLAPEQIIVAGNRCVAVPGVSSCSFSLNVTTPLPLSVTIDHNDFPTRGYPFPPDYAAGTMQPVIDGRLQFRVPWQPPQLGEKSAATATFRVAGAEPGDVVVCSHPAVTAGFIISGVVATAGDVVVVLANLAASAGIPPGGVLGIDVWKSSGAPSR